MSIFANTDDRLEPRFHPVDLITVNEKAAMLERCDNKYVASASVLESALQELATSFDILEMDGRRTFRYETCYFDDPDLRMYFDHHHGHRRRAKVRIRRYNEAELCFLETKLKDKRGITVKKRMVYDFEKFGILDEVALAHVHTSYRDVYGVEFPYELVRTLDIRYVRTTLVAKNVRERMTIDNGLSFRIGDRTYALGDDLFIIETKSANGNGIADRVLRALHRHPTKHCSKYCAGIALMWPGTKHNNFRPLLNQLLRPSLSTGTSLVEARAI